MFFKRNKKREDTKIGVYIKSNTVPIERQLKIAKILRPKYVIRLLRIYNIIINYIEK